MTTPTITWAIDWMQTSTQIINGYPEVVLTCGWSCNGVQQDTHTPPNTFTFSVFGTCAFSEPPPGDPNFTPYANLTQQQVIGWCWDSGVNKVATEAAVISNLNGQINPTTATPPLPWSA